MLDRRQLLLSGAATAALGGLGLASKARAGSKPSRLVVVFLKGGWDITYSFSPQLGNPLVDGPDLDEDPDNPDDREYVLEYGEIKLMANEAKRPSAKTFMDRWSHQVCSVQGVATSAVGHDVATFRMLTGTSSNANPDLGAILGRRFGDQVPLGYVALTGSPFVGPYAASSGQLGFNNQLKLLFDKDQHFPEPKGADYTYPIYAQSQASEDMVQAYLLERADRWRGLRGDVGPNTRQLDDLAESYDRALRFRAASADLLQALPLGKVSQFTDQAPIAAELLARDVCKAILMNDGSSWDSHSNLSVQHANYENLYHGLDTLLSELEAWEILDDTLVVVISEMCRTPRLNTTLGKDHWPHTGLLLAGAGVRGETQLGGFSEAMESLPIDLQTGALTGNAPLTHAELFAGLLEHLDIDPAAYVPGVTPFRGFMS